MYSITWYPWEDSFCYKTCKLDEVLERSHLLPHSIWIHILPVGELSFKNTEWMLNKWSGRNYYHYYFIHLVTPGRGEKGIMERTDYKYWLPSYYYQFKGLCTKAKSLLLKNRLIKEYTLIALSKICHRYWLLSTIRLERKP